MLSGGNCKGDEKMSINYEKSLGRRLANFNSKYYKPPINNASRGQCVWYTQGRAYEKKGVKIGARGNAKDVYQSCKNSGFQVSKYPKPNSIACFNGGTYGHVRYVEYVIGNTVYFTEANWNADNAVSYDDGVLKKMSLENWMKQSNLQGHVVVKKEELITFEIITKKGKLGLYKSTSIKKKNKVSIKAKTVKVVAGSGEKKGGRELVKVLYDNRYYWAIRKTRTKKQQLRRKG